MFVKILQTINIYNENRLSLNYLVNKSLSKYQKKNTLKKEKQQIFETLITVNWSKNPNLIFYSLKDLD